MAVNITKIKALLPLLQIYYFNLVLLEKLHKYSELFKFHREWQKYEWQFYKA